jgi:hypothetical protein
MTGFPPSAGVKRLASLFGIRRRWYLPGGNLGAFRFLWVAAIGGLLCQAIPHINNVL